MVSNSGENSFDVVVIGGGHAGCEAAHAAAKMGSRTLMVTLNRSRIGFMSCNPAMGGIAKGHLIKEVDAMGGLMGRITDQSAIQYRKLNASKGPAVRSSRAQCDKKMYAQNMQKFLDAVPGLEIFEGEVVGLVATATVKGARIEGIKVSDGSIIPTKCVVITSGTFLKAVMHTGFDQSEGGRHGDRSANFLSEDLKRLGFRLRRLKTGTPPRLHRQSIDWSVLEEQKGDEFPQAFSFFHKPNPFPLLKQVSCYITYTNEKTHQIIEENFDRSPMFTGIITGAGPRYCPSIEDKVKRFRDKDRHQLFLEPEGLDVDEIYVNGISTSLPVDAQLKFVHSVNGCEHAEFIRYGYAVEYDAVDARQLHSTLESKDVSGLFCAGQLNGTSGYEEAGAQGFIAGANAAILAKSGIGGMDRFTLGRADAYTGVMIDDLILKGSDEPYRMFTSRAEYRLLLREDNADSRLTEKARKVGLIDDFEWAAFSRRKNLLQVGSNFLKTNFLFPTEDTNALVVAKGFPPLKDRVSLDSFLKRPEISFSDLAGFFGGSDFELDGLEPKLKCSDFNEVADELEIEVKYDGYIKRELELLDFVAKNEEVQIPVELKFDTVSGLSTEIRNRLSETRPETLGQASRMQGITPTAIATLLIHLKMLEKSGQTLKNT